MRKKGECKRDGGGESKGGCLGRLVFPVVWRVERVSPSGRFDDIAVLKRLRIKGGFILPQL